MSFMLPSQAFFWQKKDKSLEKELQGKGYAGTLPSIGVKEEKSKTILETIKDFANEVLGKVADQHDTNKKIAGDYDKSLAVKCVNGTFVGKKTENVISIRKALPLPVKPCS